MSNSFVTLWTVACQAPLSMGFPRQEDWSGLPFPSPGIRSYMLGLLIPCKCILNKPNQPCANDGATKGKSCWQLLSGKLIPYLFLLSFSTWKMGWQSWTTRVQMNKGTIIVTNNEQNKTDWKKQNKTTDWNHGIWKAEVWGTGNRRLQGQGEGRVLCGVTFTNCTSLRMWTE